MLFLDRVRKEVEVAPKGVVTKLGKEAVQQGALTGRRLEQGFENVPVDMLDR